MEQRRRPIPTKRPYQVNPKSGHIGKQMAHPKLIHQERRKGPYAKDFQNNHYGVKRQELPVKKASSHPAARKYKNNVTNIADYRKKASLKEGGKPMRKFSLKNLNGAVRVAGAVSALAVAFFVVVFLSSTVHSLGIEISETQKELSSIQNTNQELKQQYEELANLDRVEKIAKKELQMVEPEQTILYEPKHYVANLK